MCTRSKDGLQRRAVWDCRLFLMFAMLSFLSTLVAWELVVEFRILSGVAPRIRLPPSVHDDHPLVREWHEGHEAGPDQEWGVPKVGFELPPEQIALAHNSPKPTPMPTVSAEVAAPVPAVNPKMAINQEPEHERQEEEEEEQEEEEEEEKNEEEHDTEARAWPDVSSRIQAQPEEIYEEVEEVASSQQQSLHPVDLDHYFLVIGILSAPENFEERQACRDSWLLFADMFGDFPVKVYFVVGYECESPKLSRNHGEDPRDFDPSPISGNWFSLQSCRNTSRSRHVEELLHEEQDVYGDLLRVPSVESYRRLVFKTNLLFNFLTEQTRFSYDFLLKTDDDSYVRVDRLSDKLEELTEPREKIYLGSQNPKVKVNKEKGHKWFDDVYNGTRYPTYALGSGYVLSQDLVAQLSRPKVMYPMEDVAVGIWLAGQKGIKALHMPPHEFPLIKTGEHTNQCVETMIVRRHVHDPELMRKYTDNMRRCNRMCSCPQQAKQTP